MYTCKLRNLNIKIKITCDQMSNTFPRRQRPTAILDVIIAYEAPCHCFLVVENPWVNETNCSIKSQNYELCRSTLGKTKSLEIIQS